MRSSFDLSVYLVTDPELCSARGLVETVRLAADGGATMVQLRDPEASTRRLLEDARALLTLLQPRNIPLIINDRVDVALAAGADGVHLGQDDMRPRDARRLLGDAAIIGLSVGSRDELEASRDDLPATDYIGSGPFRTTRTKEDAGSAIGSEGLRFLRGRIDLPMVAIGGIDAGNSAEAIRAAADGVAVVSAICAAPDPTAATYAIAEAVRDARGHPTI